MNDNIIYTSSSMEKNTPLLDNIIQLRGTSGQDARWKAKEAKVECLVAMAAITLYISMDHTVGTLAIRETTPIIY